MLQIMNLSDLHIFLCSTVDAYQWNLENLGAMVMMSGMIPQRVAVLQTNKQTNNQTQKCGTNFRRTPRLVSTFRNYIVFTTDALPRFYTSY